MRLLLATATGAAVFASGTATAFASQSTFSKAAAADPKCSGSAEFTKVEWTEAFVPLKDNNEVTVTATLKNPFKKGADGKWVKEDGKAVRDITGLSGEIVKAGATTGTKVDLDLPAVPAITADNEQAVALGEAKVTGKFTIGKDDKDGKWTLKLSPVRNTTAQPCVEEIAVDPQVKFVSAAVTDPVVITAGEDTKVAVKANILGASSVSARLYSNDGNDSVDLTLSKGNNANSWYEDTWFDSDFTTGSWTLELTATRGKESIKYEKADTFSVQAGKSKSKKAKSKVSFDVSANKVKKGKSIRLFGTAYRSSSAYSGKMVELYYKKKGTSGWKFLSFSKANSKGKFSKVVKPKFDAYWRAVVPGTSKTYGATSGAEFVDVR
ncbi:hypothetical protein [Streptosporangium carneum]|uniref:Uncharacterized protein n=1 Tax=Streptosporangium carneum TaxID=47481 RepID=A0A9W6HYS2_9ACTN|nr:hypothetical protein [Streptosporangium carneum]GLK08114.1 hypothetical protein GCM10017600_15190 [Streptosporangium carneum]